MDLIKMAKEVEVVLREQSADFEELAPASEDGAMWGFALDDDTSGFISLESNQGTFDIPTVSISISLGTLGEAGQEDLLELLAINGELLGATLTITPPLGDEQEEFLMLQTKFVAVEFSQDMFVKSINSLLTQVSIFFESE